MIRIPELTSSRPRPVVLELLDQISLLVTQLQAEVDRAQLMPREATALGWSTHLARSYYTSQLNG